MRGNRPGEANPGPPRIDAAGCLRGAPHLSSPNQDERPAGCAIDLLVIHSISLPPDEFGGDDVIRLFMNTLDCGSHPYYDGLRGLKVSPHFLIRRDGGIIQFVPCARRAWHAGVSCWQGRARCNDFSIGIELEGSDSVPFADAQYEALDGLTRALRQAYVLRDIVGHADVAPGRKSDPGPRFDWARYRAALEAPGD